MTKVLKKFPPNNSLYKCLQVLPEKDRTKVFIVAISQALLSFLDLLGVAIIGLVGALSVNGIRSISPGSRIGQVLSVLNLESFSLQMQVAILGISAALILLIRTGASIVFNRKILFFLSRKGARISADLTRKWLNQPLTGVQRLTTQETLFALTFGVQTITLGVISTLVILLSDFTLLLFLIVGLFVIDPITASITIFLFSGIAIILYLLSSKKIVKLSKLHTDLSLEGNENILQALNAFREATVGNRRGHYSDIIGANRFRISDLSAEIAFIPNISKYVIEGSVIIGAILIAGLQFLLKDSTQAVATLAVFIVAGSRIAPAFMRIQQGAIQIRSSLGGARPTLRMIELVNETPIVAESNSSLDFSHQGFSSNLLVNQLSFRYPDSDRNALSKVSFELNEGEFLAVVGPSGSGKSTLVDALLGVLEPLAGKITISGISPLESIGKWPGAIAYVPQSVKVFQGTVEDNIMLGYPRSEENVFAAKQAVERAKLQDFISTLPHGLLTEVGEGGSRLSGGQQQRLGIARALFTNPKLLVLDEATSALDAMTESILSEALEDLRGEITIVMIAHRLSTIRNADKVIYIENGTVRASGNFEELKAAVPDFEKQAEIMGL